ncbi:MAG: hypothetical protein C0616_00490 [Desulfuromonas sp.]|nr:MAG: hypothetical protein C0616_00490 [Desulfuromonas sp.]
MIENGGLRIIVFEDDPALANLLKHALHSRGHKVSVFSDPTLCPVFKEQETACPSKTPCADVILSDQMMPNMTGLEFFKLQRARGCKAKDANKAILTGSAMLPELQKEVHDLGYTLFKKPFKVSEVLAWIDDCAARLA